jgi:LysM repeat protein
MKKFLFFVFVMSAVLLGIYSEDQFLWCTRLFSNDPHVHTIQKGEYFSKISQQYYGTATYWKELAMINRAPISDLVFPGEEIVVPSLEAIQELRKSRSLTLVNKIVKGQEDWIASNVVEPTNSLTQNNAAAYNRPMMPQQPAEQVQQSESSTHRLTQQQPVEAEKASLLPIFIIGLVTLFVIGGLTFIIVKGRKKKEAKKETVLKKERVKEKEDGHEDDFTSSFSKKREPMLVE